MTEQELIEQLADHAHASWTHWMRYLFSRSEMQPDGSVVIPAGLVERWQRQIATSYADLSETEKQSDRNQVMLSLHVIRQFANDKAITF